MRVHNIMIETKVCLKGALSALENRCDCLVSSDVHVLCSGLQQKLLRTGLVRALQMNIVIVFYYCYYCSYRLSHSDNVCHAGMHSMLATRVLCPVKA